MRGGWKTLIAAFVALLLAAGLVACGGDDSDSTTTEAVSQGQAGGGSDGGSENSDSNDGPKPGSGGGEDPSRGEDAGSFTPKEHDDSGGGSQQFILKGGDNSVQEFGEEADSSEFNAAARALHNFLDARAEGEWAAACSYLASDIIASLRELAGQTKQVDATDCAGILGNLTNPAAKGALLKEARLADIGSLRVEDDRAFVIYRGLDGAIMAIAMTQEDGDWKVASLAGTPLN